jgi:hypothetical protein
MALFMWKPIVVTSFSQVRCVYETDFLYLIKCFAFEVLILILVKQFYFIGALRKMGKVIAHSD